MQDCFFFKNSTYNLFGCLHKPDKNERQNGIGLVICSPFAEEKLWSHRVIVNFAKYLAGNGFSVLCFDYMGHGDSEGAFEDSNIETRFSDIKCAVNVIKEKSKIQTIGLLGLRLGATLAAVSAERDLSLDFLVLWEPIVHVETYLKQCLRSNVAMQSATYGKVKYTREKMIQDLLANRTVNIDGYLISGSFYRQASSIDLGKISPKYSKPVCVVHISKSDSGKAPKIINELYQNYYQLSSNAKLEIVKEKPFWTGVNSYYQIAEDLFSSTLYWLIKLEKLD